jgi:pimeloyl-ACP methyl ester carboxylesterase
MDEKVSTKCRPAARLIIGRILKGGLNMRTSIALLIMALLCAAPDTSRAGGATVSSKRLGRLDQPDVLTILFHPRRDFSSTPDGAHDVSIPVAEGVRLGGRLHVAGRNSPVILLFHGNGEIASDYDDISRFYTQMGISLLVVDYRGYGKSTGTPSCSALLDDAMATYLALHDILSRYGLDESRLFVMGRSLGSAAAIEIASRVGDEISGLIIESGFADTFPLLERLGGLSLPNLTEKDDGFNNVGKMEQVLVPTLIIHGEADYLIPVTDGKALFDHCKAAKKRLVTIPRAGHNDLLFRGQKTYFDSIRTFVLE